MDFYDKMCENKKGQKDSEDLEPRMKEVRCSKCGYAFLIKNNVSGHKLRCIYCGRKIIINDSANDTINGYDEKQKWTGHEDPIIDKLVEEEIKEKKKALIILIIGLIVVSLVGVLLYKVISNNINIILYFCIHYILQFLAWIAAACSFGRLLLSRRYRDTKYLYLGIIFCIIATQLAKW